MTNASSAFRSINSGARAPAGRPLPGACVALTAAVVLGLLTSTTMAQVAEDPLVEARRVIQAGNYEAGVTAATRAIELNEPRARSDRDVRLQLIEAYELRARARFGLADAPGASTDLEALLKLNPDHTLPAEVSPRFVRLFESVRQARTGEIVLTIAPDNAEADVDGNPLAGRTGTIRLTADTHVISAKRKGYRPQSQTIRVEPGAKQEVTLTLERQYATASFVTSPPGVEVFVDDVSKGITQGGELAADAQEVATRLGVPVAALSAPLVVSELSAASHRIEFRRPCFVTKPGTLPITALTDIAVEPIKLEPATAQLTFEAGIPAGSVVHIDDVSRGTATTLTVCEGSHIVEVRSPTGRYVERVPALRGKEYLIRAKVKPAFAVLSSAGGESVRRADDIRLVLEERLRSAESVTLYAPPAQAAGDVLKKAGLPATWLDFSRLKQPLGQAATFSADARRKLSTTLSSQLEAQGVAAITVVSSSDPPDIRVSLLASGSSEPDVLEIRLSEPASIRTAIAALSFSMPLFSPSAGLLTLDVLDPPAPGAVVAKVDPAGPAAAAGLAPGDVIVAADGQPVPDASALEVAMKAALAAGRLSIDVRDRNGAARRADLTIVRAPRAITSVDQTILFNTLLVNLRNRLGAARGTPDEHVLRLNIGIALIALGNWQDAATELEQVRLKPGSGVAEGTLQYYRGLCYEALSRFAEAETAWNAAKASDAWLTEDGPPIRRLAEEKLAAKGR